MFRRLHLPYAKLRELWNICIISGQNEYNLDADTIEQLKNKFFGVKKSRTDPDFLLGSVATAQYFGDYEVFKSDGFTPNGEIKHPEERLKKVLKKLDDYSPILSELCDEVITADDIGRYYDEDGRVYLRGLEPGEFYVRLPIHDSDSMLNTNPVGLPEPDTTIFLYRRDEIEEYVVGDVAIPTKDRRITARIMLYIRKDE